MSNEPKAVAWQYRERLDEEWGPWLGCDANHVKRLESREDCQVRALYGAEALSALRAEVEALRRDADRLDWLERFVRKAYVYGASFAFA